MKQNGGAKRKQDMPSRFLSILYRLQVIRSADHNLNFKNVANFSLLLWYQVLLVLRTNYNATTSGRDRWRVNIFGAGNSQIDLCNWWHSSVVRNSTHGDISPAPNQSGRDTTLLVIFSVIWSKQGDNLPFDVRHNCVATTPQNAWTSVQLFKWFEYFCGKRQRKDSLFPSRNSA